MSTPQTGTCLCGACTFTAVPMDNAGACHCGMCRKWSGGMYLSVSCEDVKIAEGAPIGIYRGSPWGERVFCRECGASLMWRSQDGAHNNVSIQAFEDPSQFELEMQLFIDKKPANYALTNQTKTMTEADVFALYAPQDDAQ
ncbi:GFA family protein [Gymnodinialimonas sp. 2305UL16-5]|uniref:GFA family protein n=1 Tax=Gymnodinialimonas mytili TaxID=3126503 RepID=UPI0030A4705D